MFESKLFKYIDKADHSEKMTKEMIKRIVGGKESLYALSKELGCSYSYLRLIKQGKIYKAQVAEALKELGLESAEIHSHDTKLPSEHKAPTANTPQSEVDLTTYENPNNILQLLKVTSKYANLEAWSDWLNKHYGKYNGRYSKRFEKPETYIPTAVKINSKVFKDERLTLNLLITYASNSIDEKLYQASRFIIKGEFIVTSVKGKPSIAQKGKLNIESASSQERFEGMFKTDDEHKDTRAQNEENLKHNTEVAKRFMHTAESEAKSLMRGIVENSPYEIKHWSLNHEYDGRYELVIDFMHGTEKYSGEFIDVKATYENGETKEQSLRACFRKKESWGSEVSILTPKIKNIVFDKAKTLESLKYAFKTIVNYALRTNKATEKISENAKKELSETYHSFMSHTHWTTLHLKVTDEGTRFHFAVAESGERLDKLLSKGDYNKLINSPYDHFYLGIKDGKVQFVNGDGSGRPFTAKECLEFLDNIDRLASNNLKKAVKGKEAVAHEAADTLAKIEAILTPLKHFDSLNIVAEVVNGWANAEEKLVIVKVRENSERYGGYIINWSIRISPSLNKPAFAFDDNSYRSTYKKKSKEQILEFMKEHIKTLVTKLSKN